MTKGPTTSDTAFRIQSSGAKQGNAGASSFAFGREADFMARGLTVGGGNHMTAAGYGAAHGAFC